MHITLEADYAVRIVHCLAKNGQRMDAKSISDETGVTLRFSLKILRKLVSAGIIKSYKGTQGGYEIARPLEEITLNDVIETVEGPFALSRCLTAVRAAAAMGTVTVCSVVSMRRFRRRSRRSSPL